jgi:hypothetical protein
MRVRVLWVRYTIFELVFLLKKIDDLLLYINFFIRPVGLKIKALFNGCGF